ncbi:MAG: DUF481 domain-containing protein [Colwellia sp.]
MFYRFILFSSFFVYFTLSTPLYAQEQSNNDAAEPADILFGLAKADESIQPPSGTLFTASAQFGLLYLTGDIHSVDIKTGFDLEFEKNLWRSIFNFDLLIKKTETEVTLSNDKIDKSLETTSHNWSIFSQTNYTVNPIYKNYLYGSLFYKEDRFSSFDSQASVSTGWGRRWYEAKDVSFDADIGPGFKRDVTLVTAAESSLGVTSETKISVILQMQALYTRRLNEFIEFKQLFIVKHAIRSGENSIYEAESSITSKLIDSLQLKLNFAIDYNSKVDDANENLNTETSAVLIYSF